MTLLIMAAGIGSRFGGGIKQLEPVSENGEIIMDYSIHDAIEAGFKKIIFVIRKDIEDDFREAIGNRIEKLCKELGVKVEYAFQDLYDIPKGQSVPEGRVKPWGTGQAVLAAKNVIDEPFVVINADDYYGKEAYKSLLKEMSQNCGENYRQNAFCMAGFVLKNTLSENGGVTRGICRVDEQGYLTQVVETSDIVKTESGAEAEGEPIDVNSAVSMNMWGLTPEFVGVLESGFAEFFRDKVPNNPQKAEFLLPIFIGELLKDKKVSVKVAKSSDKWFGVTYKEDKPFVVESFKKLIEGGVYQKDLFSDLK
ncbi:MAG: nucleotidyltransferase [Oscillospiraceae bacterium]|nr:nucleotidyltransferase [Oscillospiraceae bacterium]